MEEKQTKRRVFVEFQTRTPGDLYDATDEELEEMRNSGVIYQPYVELQVTTLFHKNGK